MVDTQWNRHLVSLLIENFRAHPCLWKVKHKDYKNKTLRLQALRQIKSVLSVFVPNLTEELLRKKIDGIRGQFRRELKNKINSKKSGAGTADLYVPKLWFFDDLSFLIEGDSITEPISTLTIETSNAEAVVSFVIFLQVGNVLPLLMMMHYFFIHFLIISQS